MAVLRETKSFGRYSLIAELGVSGSVELFSAREGPEADPVLLQRLSAQGSRSPGVRAAFAERCRTLGRVEHPSVVELLELGEIDGRPYCTVERVDGCDLQTLRKRAEQRGRVLPTSVVLAIALNAADVAHFLERRHSRLQCSLQPNRILLSRSGQVKFAAVNADPVEPLAVRSIARLVEQLLLGRGARSTYSSKLAGIARAAYFSPTDYSPRTLYDELRGYAASAGLSVESEQLARWLDEVLGGIEVLADEEIAAAAATAQALEPGKLVAQALKYTETVPGTPETRRKAAATGSAGSGVSSPPPPPPEDDQDPEPPTVVQLDDQSSLEGDDGEDATVVAQELVESLSGRMQLAEEETRSAEMTAIAKPRGSGGPSAAPPGSTATRQAQRSRGCEQPPRAEPDGVGPSRVELDDDALAEDEEDGDEPPTGIFSAEVEAEDPPAELLDEPAGDDDFPPGDSQLLLPVDFDELDEPPTAFHDAGARSRAVPPAEPIEPSASPAERGHERKQDRPGPAPPVSTPSVGPPALSRTPSSISTPSDAAGRVDEAIRAAYTAVEHHFDAGAAPDLNEGWSKPDRAEHVWIRIALSVGAVILLALAVTVWLLY